MGICQKYVENDQGLSQTELTFQDDLNKLVQDQQMKFNWGKHEGLCLDADIMLDKNKMGELSLGMTQLKDCSLMLEILY